VDGHVGGSGPPLSVAFCVVGNSKIL
jgi:hypothetical protein